MTFDITAPIERQFTRDGRKVAAIFDSGLNCKYPISAWIEEGSKAVAVTKAGNFYQDGDESSCDIITRAEPLPLIVSFHNVYALMNRALVNDSLQRCKDFGFDETLAIIKTTFDPNTGISSAETVWQKEEK